MSVRRIKTWLMTAAVAGLLGLVAGDAHAFGGKLFGKKSCGDPCADACAAPAADCGAGNGCAAPAAPAAPATQRVLVKEYVPTTVEETVTVMRPTKKIETYTAHKYECVPETVTYQVTVNKLVTETVIENRHVTEKVPVTKTVTVHEKVPVTKTVTVQERVPVTKTVTVMEKRPVTKQVTVNETRVTTVQVTEMQTKTVVNKVSVPYCKDLGPSLSDRLKKMCDPCYEPCPRTKTGCKTERHCETVCVPVTKCKKVCETVPVTKTVCTYECVPVQKQVCTYECVPVQKQVCTYECVPVQKQVTAYECVTKCVPTPVTRTKCVPTCETHTKTVNVKKCVAYQATREVTVCVPVQERVKVTKLVCQEVYKDVPVSSGCGDACAAPAAAYHGSYAKAGLFDKLKGGFGKKSKGGCCEAPAACGAAAACCH